MRTKQIIYSILIVALLGACKKGELMAVPEMKKLTVKCYSLVAEARYTVTVNDIPFYDSLVNNTKEERNMVMPEGKHHIVVKDFATSKIVQDTLVELPGRFPSFTVLNLGGASADHPQLIVSGGGDMPDKNIQWSFYYTDPLMPDSVRITIYRLNQRLPDYQMDGTIDTLQTLVASKGRLSDPVRLDLSGDAMLDNKPNPMLSAYALVLRDVHSGQVLPGAELDVANGSVTYFPYYEYNPAIKNYISDLNAFDYNDGSGRFLYYSILMMLF